MWLMKIDEDPFEDYVSIVLNLENDVFNVIITCYIMLLGYMT